MSKHYKVKQVIVVRRDLRNVQGHRVRSDKIAAQVAHASMMWLSHIVRSILRDEAAHGVRMAREYFSDAELAWLEGSFTKIVVGCDNEEELYNLVNRASSSGIRAMICIDNGTTEFGGAKTVTCAAFGPCESELLDEVTGHLKGL